MTSERTDGDIVTGWMHGISGTSVRPGRVVHVEHVWGTAVTLSLAGTQGREAEARSAVADCCDYFQEVDATFSTHRVDTEVTLFRAGLDRPGHQSPQFTEVIQECRRLRVLTRGAFDPWAVPGGYDPSGYVKGWAVGNASRLLHEAGFGDHLVNAGGDIEARGDEVPGSGQGWPVGIVNPHAPTEVIEVVVLRDQAMATSGRYERGDHVVDPSTGLPALDVASATVVGPDAGVADALASAAMVNGVESMTWFAGLGPEWSLHVVVGQVAHTFGPAFP